MVGKKSRFLKRIDGEQQGYYRCHYERALVITMILGLEWGMRRNPFELIDERVQVKLPFGSLDPPPWYT